MSGTLVAPIHPGEKHLAAVLLVDTSMSMMEKPIEELNHGLEEFGHALATGCACFGKSGDYDYFF